MALGKTIFFKKLSEGGVSIYLQDVEGILPARWFQLDYKVPRIGVPVNYALSIFTDSNVEKLLKRKYFEVENMADLIAIAEERNYIAPSEEQVKELVAPSRTKELLLKIIQGGNEVKLRELFASADRNRALEIAVANSNTLTMEVVQRIEEILGMAITEI